MDTREWTRKPAAAFQRLTMGSRVPGRFMAHQLNREREVLQLRLTHPCTPAVANGWSLVGPSHGVPVALAVEERVELPSEVTRHRVARRHVTLQRVVKPGDLLEVSGVFVLVDA